MLNVAWQSSSKGALLTSNQQKKKKKKQEKSLLIIAVLAEHGRVNIVSVCLIQSSLEVFGLCVTDISLMMKPNPTSALNSLESHTASCSSFCGLK